MTQREIATIGFSPYNRVLETIDANVTFYENEVELIHGLNFRQIQNYAMPGILIVAAGIDKPTYQEVLIYLKEENINMPVVVYDQAFNRSRKREAYRAGAFDYIADPIEDDLFEVRVKNVFESAEGKILVSMDNSPRTP